MFDKMIKLLKKFLLNQHIWFMTAVTVAIVLLQWDIHRNHKTSDILSTTFSQYHTLYHGRQNLAIDFTDYAKSLMHKLTLQVTKTAEGHITECDTPQSDVFDRVDMAARRADVFHTLADTNFHAVTAYLDDRVPGGYKYLRILGAGLYPVPKGKSHLYCAYDCDRGRCSAVVFGAVIVAGNYSDYPPVHKRLSLMDVMQLVCPVASSDHPKTVTITTSPCGVTHNYLDVQHFNFEGIVQPPWDVGVCGGIVDMSKVDISVFAVWLEYLRIHGVAAVHVYIHRLQRKKLKRLIHFYENETLRILYSEAWDHINSRLDDVLVSELALNHCIYSNMRKYRYILHLPFNSWIKVSKQYQHLKQLVRIKEFQSKMTEFGGLGIVGNHAPQSIIVKSAAVLLTAANHFVPLCVPPVHHMLDSADISVTSYEAFSSSSLHKNIISALNNTVKRKLKGSNS